MDSEYDSVTAFHYASYRPPLHSVILKECLKGNLYDFGLDIGSGTGQSSIALADFCDTVAGIDPSTDMLSKGIIHPKVTYSFFDSTRVDFEDNTFSIITLAGSLWYAKSQELLNEIVRVGSEDAIVLVYDFEVLLNDILVGIGFETKPDESAVYNHQEDFSGLTMERMAIIRKGSERVQFKITSQDLAHLILSVKGQYTFLAQTHDTANLYHKIVERLPTISDAEANTFYTSYRIN